MVRVQQKGHQPLLDDGLGGFRFPLLPSSGRLDDHHHTEKAHKGRLPENRPDDRTKQHILGELHRFPPSESNQNNLPEHNQV
jgi:hypothetical protein